VRSAGNTVNCTRKHGRGWVPPHHDRGHTPSTAGSHQPASVSSATPDSNNANNTEADDACRTTWWPRPTQPTNSTRRTARRFCPDASGTSLPGPARNTDSYDVLLAPPLELEQYAGTGHGNRFHNRHASIAYSGLANNTPPPSMECLPIAPLCTSVPSACSTSHHRSLQCNFLAPTSVSPAEGATVSSPSRGPSRGWVAPGGHELATGGRATSITSPPPRPGRRGRPPFLYPLVRRTGSVEATTGTACRSQPLGTSPWHPACNLPDTPPAPIVGRHRQREDL